MLVRNIRAGRPRVGFESGSEDGQKPSLLGDSRCETPAVWHPPVNGPVASDASGQWLLSVLSPGQPTTGGGVLKKVHSLTSTVATKQPSRASCPSHA